jgi:hypothetical protein
VCPELLSADHADPARWRLRPDPGGDRQRQLRATALYGYGGIGKSTLAAAVAQDCAVRRRFKDGVYWIEIEQHPENTSSQADLGALLGDSREHYTDPTAGKTRLSHLLADEQALIVSTRTASVGVSVGAAVGDGTAVGVSVAVKWAKARPRPWVRRWALIKPSGTSPRWAEQPCKPTHPKSCLIRV